MIIYISFSRFRVFYKKLKNFTTKTKHVFNLWKNSNDDNNNPTQNPHSKPPINISPRNPTTHLRPHTKPCHFNFLSIHSRHTKAGGSVQWPSSSPFYTSIVDGMCKDLPNTADHGSVPRLSWKALQLQSWIPRNIWTLFGLSQAQGSVVMDTLAVAVMDCGTFGVDEELNL